MDLKPSAILVRFGVFELDLRARELRKNGLSTGLPEQSIKILALLLEKPGEVVLRQEIRKKLWPNDTVVEFDHSINAAMQRLRQALGDSADRPRYIETLARRGYRWMVPVEWIDPNPDTPQEAVPTAASLPAESTAPNLTGKKISHYRVLEILGGGGMGVVYKAEDLKLGRRIALKFLPEELGNDAKAVERFEREARAASALDHPNICSIYEFGEHEGHPFIVMQLLEGQTLRERMGVESQPRQPLPVNELLDFAIQISSGLEAAHQKGVIHRDIKPANIFITNRREAKILDFGVAKLVQGDGQPHASAPGESHNNAELPDAAPSLLSLTLTGTNLGTAGYMSPEQLLGEELDTRSDLFSFGLVLYEMATGQRAFSGDTAFGIRENVLTQTSRRARELNPAVPAKLEKIIGRALEKDREARYQSAAEMRFDLSNLIQEKRPKLVARRWAIAVGVVASMIAVFWFGRVVLSPPGQLPPEPKLRQLTNNSFENRVLFGAISPDGKYLAYSDANGIRIQLVATGERRVVPQPEEPEGKEVDWEIEGTWFPDSTRFVANAHPMAEDENNWSSQTTSIWLVSVIGGPPHKLRDSAIAFSVSPDGSLIGFASKKGQLGESEIWLMDSSGEQARKLFDTDKGTSIGGLSWSGDGTRVLYTKSDQSGDTLLSRDLKGGPPTFVLDPNEMKQVNDFLWLADGRLLYSVQNPEFSDKACSFWEMRLDSRTGTPTEKPRKLTNWTGFCATNLSETSDGKKLAFVRRSEHTASYVANLAAGGTRILQPKHFPLTERSESVADWAPDSKSVILVSNRTGQYGIYKQFLDKDMSEPLVTHGYERDPHVSPDGKSVIYLGTGENGPWPIRGPEPVMRVSIAGGPSQRLFTASSGSLLTCARSPSDMCAIGEPIEDGKQLTVSAFDPMKGRGPELFRFALGSSDGNWRVNITPDGTRFVALPSSAGPIHIFSLHGDLLQQIRLKGWSRLQTAIWAADGKSLFVTADIRGGAVVLHVDLQGNAHALWEYTGGSGETLVHPSPDGRHLAFDSWTNSANMWLMENF